MSGRTRIRCYHKERSVWPARPRGDRFTPGRLQVGARAQQAEAAGQHLIAVRHGEVDRQPRAAAAGTRPRADDRHELQRHRLDHPAPARRARDRRRPLSWRDAAIGQAAQPADQARRGQQPGMMLEEPHELPAAELERQGVEVAHVDDQRVGMRRHDRVFERAQHGRRRRIHHDDRQARPGLPPASASARSRVMIGGRLRASECEGAQPPVMLQALSPGSPCGTGGR